MIRSHNTRLRLSCLNGACRSVIEGLEHRRMLANDPLTVGTFLVGTVPWLNITGTANDDTIVIQKTASTTFRITNGTWAVNRTGTWPGVRVVAGAGADSVSTAGSLTFRTIFYGDAGNDSLTGGALADSLFGGADDDSLVGGSGNDTLRGEAGNDTFSGGAGADNALGGLGDDVINGGNDNDSLGGDGGADTINGDLGNDTLFGGTEVDSINGGDGNDSLRGDAGADVLDGDGGNDIVYGGTEGDAIEGDAGNDSLYGDAGNDTLAGSAGADFLNGGANDDSVDGGTENDKIAGDAGTDTYVGGAGTDSLDYAGRTELLTLSYDDQANDGASGEADNVPSDIEALYGGNSADSITGSAGANMLNGGAGNDTIDGAGGNDKLYGGAGHDSISGGDGNDSLWGQADNDKLFGNDGEDLLEGGAGNDQSDGGAGRDRLIALGGGIYDSLTGGDGLDSYWLDRDSTEKTLDVSSDETAAKAVHRVASFVNYGSTVISKEVNGAKLAEPARHADLTTANTKVTNFSSYKLFADAGPDIDDINQGRAGDCWWLSSIAGVAKIYPELIRQMITDLGDGTFAVRFYVSGAERYVRVDGDLYTYSWAPNVPRYAGLGAENSTWVALVEKAFTWIRSGGGTLGRYATLDGGWMTQAYSAMGLTNRAPGWGTFTSAGAAVNFIRTQLDAGYTVTLGTKETVGYNMVRSHAYTIDRVIENNDGTYSVVVRNPWGVDANSSTDGSNDGYLTLTTAQMFSVYSGLSAA